MSFVKVSANNVVRSSKCFNYFRGKFNCFILFSSTVEMKCSISQMYIQGLTDHHCSNKLKLKIKKTKNRKYKTIFML